LGKVNFRRQDDREVLLWNGDRLLAVSFAVDDWNGGSPVPLSRHQPVSKPNLGGICRRECEKEKERKGKERKEKSTLGLSLPNFCLMEKSRILVRASSVVKPENSPFASLRTPSPVKGPAVWSSTKK